METVGIDTEEQISKPRFHEYYEESSLFEFKQGDLEPHQLKYIRPFLLSNEVPADFQGNLRSGKGGKGNKRNTKGGKGGKSKSSGESAKVFTGSNPPPFINKYIPSNQPYRITQELNAGTILTTSTTVPTFGATSFSVNSLDQISQLGAVWDQYKIEEIEVWLFSNTMGASTGAQQGLVYSVLDYDDASNLSTIGQAEDYTNVVTMIPTDSIYRRFRPHVAVAAYSGTFTSFSNVEAPWIDFASPNVQHYGLKLAATATAAAVSFYTLQVRYHLAFRNVR
jgi:hypothetical protein